MIVARPLQPLLPAAAAFGALLVGAAVVYSPIAGFLLLGPISVALLLLSPGVAVPLLVLSSALNRYGMQWGDASVRLDYLVVLLLAGVAASRIAVRTLRLDRFRSPLNLPILAYAGLNLLSTSLFASEKIRGYKLDAEIIAVAICYLVVVALVVGRRDLESAMTALWIVTVGEAAVGISLMALVVLHVTTLGVQMADLPMAYGTQWEANIFGSFLLGNFFLLLGDHVRRGPSVLRTVGLLLVVVGIVASITRTVWLALLLGLVVFVALLLRFRGYGGRMASVLVAVPVVTLLGLIVGSATPFAGRLLDIVNLQTSSASGRLFIYRAALDESRHHLLLGSGTGSWNLGAIPGQPHPWLPNLFLLTLNDTGIIGLVALLWLLWAFYRLSWRAMRIPSDVSLIVAGAVASFTGLLLAFQSTSGFWFTYPWIVLGLGTSAARLARQSARDP